jgi:hypothetical protein
MPFCPDCGVEVDAEDVHCYNCGRNLEGGHAGPQRDEGHSSDDQWGSSWDEGSRETVTREQTPATGQSTTATGQNERGGEPNAEASGRRIEDGKVEYTTYFPITREYSAVALGAVCAFLGFFIVPLFILFGYTYRITEAAARGDAVQPAFEDWGDLLEKGFFYFLLVLALMLINFVGAGTLAVVGESAGVPAAGGFAILVLWLLTTYAWPAVMVLYPVTGSLSKALSPGRIANFAFTTKYIVSYLIYIGLLVGFFVLSFIGMFVLAITVIGIFLLIPLVYAVNAYLPYAIGTFWGATYYEAAKEGHVPHVSAQDEPTQDEPYITADSGTGWD